jgi:gliding motility-associated-like protein
MKNTLAISLICFFFAINAFAQKEAANWYFGSNAGIRFNPDGSTASLADGKLNTDEGCTTISDSNGNLLFYTDGITVWNRLHQPMPNANGAFGNGLYGDPSSSQSAIVVPKPDDPNIYYVFTVDTSSRFGDINRGFNYSIVDLRLNEGLGDVVVSSKNTNLLEYSSEKISAVLKDCISKSIWVITFAPLDGLAIPAINTFYAYEISSAGINTAPVVSTFDIFIEDARGYLKLSPNGKKLACANSISGLYLYDFDTTTGIVSNQEYININFAPESGYPQSPYGIEFSQSNELLYVSAYYNGTREDFNVPSSQYGSLLQYDLTAANISDSETVIDDRQMYRGALQLGPNGKIYRAMNTTYEIGTPYLSTINNPNERGLACNYVHNAVALSSNSRQGLPPFISSFFAEKIDIIGNESSSTNLPLCLGDTYTLKGPDIPGAKYTWTRDELPLSNNGFDLEVSQSGLYKLLIDEQTGNCDGLLEGEAYVTYSPVPIAYNATLVQCDEDGIPGGSTRFNLHEADVALTGGVDGLSTKFYSDITRSTEIDGYDYNHDTNNPNPIYVKVIIDGSNCFDTSILTLIVNNVPRNRFVYPPLCDELNSEDGINTFNLNEITSGIQAQKGIGLPMDYYISFENALLEKNNLGTSFSNTTPYSQTIYARFENQNACQGIIEVVLSVNKLPTITTEDLVYYCTNKFPETISINAGNLYQENLTDGINIDNYNYQWSTGESTYQIEINEAKKYTVLVTNNKTNCSKERTIDVQASGIAEKPIFEVTDATQNNLITVLASGSGNYEYAIDNNSDGFFMAFQQSNVFENVPPGIHTVLIKDIKNDCGTLPFEVAVIGFPKFFTPNNDGINDTWQVFGISEKFYSDSKISIYNRYGLLIKTIDPLGNGWDGLFNGNILPTDDYWFSVELEDGRIFKNHFTLKR